MNDHSEFQSVDEIKPYMFEPMSNENATDIDSSESDTDSTHASEDEVDQEFETINRWRLSTLDWCKCGNCDLMVKTVESFCCHEKAIEYDEYDDKLKSAQDRGYTCITKLSSFKRNISNDVLEVDVMQYIEENWPVDDEDVARMHKLFRLVGYRRCSRWIFQILGKKCRRPFPACIYKCMFKTCSLRQSCCPENALLLNLTFDGNWRAFVLQ